jgi:hypothetical protein
VFAASVSEAGVAEQSSARKRKPAGKAEPAEGADPEFEGWLDVRLKSIYDSVLNEPLPEEMMKLLSRPKSSP